MNENEILLQSARNANPSLKNELPEAEELKAKLDPSVISQKGVIGELQERNCDY